MPKADVYARALAKLDGLISRGRAFSDDRYDRGYCAGVLATNDLLRALLVEMKAQRSPDPSGDEGDWGMELEAARAKADAALEAFAGEGEDHE